MAVEGSLYKAILRQKARMPQLMENTVSSSLNRLQTQIKDRTPVDSGDLQDSIVVSEVGTDVRGNYIGEVFSELEYAASIEYGAAAHVIKAKEGEGLTIGGNVRKEVEHPGNGGRHMFAIGMAAFKQGDAERIMRIEFRKWKRTL